MRKIVRFSVIEVSDTVNAAPEIEAEMVSFLDLQTAEVVALPVFLVHMAEEDELDYYHSKDLEDLAIANALAEDPERFVQVSPVESWQSYEWRKDFASSLPAAYAQKVLKALEGSGAYARFYDCINQLEHLADAWALFEHHMMEEYLNDLAPQNVRIELI